MNKYLPSLLTFLYGRVECVMKGVCAPAGAVRGVYGSAAATPVWVLGTVIGLRALQSGRKRKEFPAGGCCPDGRPAGGGYSRPALARRPSRADTRRRGHIRPIEAKRGVFRERADTPRTRTITSTRGCRRAPGWRLRATASHVSGQSNPNTEYSDFAGLSEGVAGCVTSPEASHRGMA